ncbi:hypothetical protein ACFVAV_08575 [Nocardia sp. NPDC057663]|uniref:hypothetical protein n=1 Tax=Nocardia sp. NPDC057663 TaxID=3346201 RepID=UPI0036721BEB
MNHAEHDESIGSMLASIAAALREVSDKLDIVAARVQQEVPVFPADEDLPDQTRIRRLESWAFHASQDISRLSARLDALDGGEPEQTTPRAGRGTRSRREVREAAEAAERAAADLDEGAPDGGAAEPDRAVDAARPPLERRHSRTDHLGDPTWPITVAPIPRPAAAFESAGEVGGAATGVAAMLGSEGASRSPFTDSTQTVNGAQPIDRTQRLNGARSADTAVNGARAADRPTRNGAAANGALVLNGAAPLSNTQAANGAATVNGVTAIDDAQPIEARPTNHASTQVGDEVSAPLRDAVPAPDGGTQSAVAGGADSAEAGHTRNGQPIGHGSDPVGAAVSNTAHVPASSTLGVPASTGATPAAIGTLQADADQLSAAHPDRLPAAGGRKQDDTEITVPGRVAAQTGAISALGRDDTSPATQSSGSTTLGSRGGSSLPGSAEVGDVVRGGDVTLSGVTADQANTAAMKTIPEGRADIGHRPLAEAGVERARPVGKPAESTAAPVGDTGARPGSPDALSGTGIDATQIATTRAMNDPRSAGLTAGGRTEPVTNGHPVNGFGAPLTATPATPTSGSTANGIHWTFTDEDATLPPPSRNGHARNGFTGGDSPHRTESIFDDFTPRERLTTPSGNDAPTPADPPARLSAPNSHADPGTGGFAAATQGLDPALPHGTSSDVGAPAGTDASTNGRGPAELTPSTPTDFSAPTHLGTSGNGRGPGELTHSTPTGFGGPTNPNASVNGRGPASFDPAVNDGAPSGFGAPVSAGEVSPATSPLDRVVADPVPPSATDAAGITVTGTFRAFDIERAHVDKLQAMLDELKRSAGLPPGRRDVFGPPTTEAG